MTEISSLTVPQGATYTATAQLLIDGTPVDLTGFQARMQVRDQRSKAGALICDLTEANGRITVSDGPAGIVTITVDGATTAGLPVGQFSFTVEAFCAPPNPMIYQVASGLLTVTEGL